tara:strand:+ start:170 stop:316 length:147 start_codon:yes stop_codon:yes gene_type:complete
MKKFLKDNSGTLMVILGGVIIFSDIIGFDGVITFAVGIVLIVEGLDRI